MTSSKILTRDMNSSLSLCTFAVPVAVEGKGDLLKELPGMVQSAPKPQRVTQLEFVCTGIEYTA